MNLENKLLIVGDRPLLECPPGSLIFPTTEPFVLPEGAFSYTGLYTIDRPLLVTNIDVYEHAFLVDVLTGRMVHWPRSAINDYFTVVRLGDDDGH